MKKSLLCLISTLIIVGVLSLSSCGCIKETKEEPKEVIKETKEEPKEVFGDEKMKTLPHGWKWYENKEWGLRIGYPRNWRVGPDPLIPHNDPPRDIDFKKGWLMFGTLMFDIYSEEVGEDFDLMEYTVKKSRCGEEEVKDVIIGGVPGKQTKRIVVTEGTERLTEVTTFVVYKGRLFEFFFIEEEVGEIGYRMLDTVEFIGRK
jgi:hypothetical protein